MIVTVLWGGRVRRCLRVPMWLDWLLMLLPLLSLAPKPAGGGAGEDSGGGEELSVSPTSVLVMQMLGSVSGLSLLNRRRIGSLQSRNEPLSDAELVVGGVARFHR